MLVNAAQMCGRRAGVVEARKCFLQLFQMLEKAADPAAVGFASFSEDVATIRRSKLASTKKLTPEIVDSVILINKKNN